MIGTNNINRLSSTPRQTAEGIQVIVLKLRKTYPEMKILVLHVFPREERPDAKRRDRIRELNSYLPKLVGKEKNVTLLDIGDKFLDENGIISKSIMPDFLHPNENGYEIWAKAMEPTLKKLLVAGPSHQTSILIMADDLGYHDLGCYGHPKIKTPVLDGLAKNGIRLTSFYSGATVCTPSRMALLTGAYPSRLGWTKGVVGHMISTKKGLSPKALTIAEIFKDKGYQTGLVGKWEGSGSGKDLGSERR